MLFTIYPQVKEGSNNVLNYPSLLYIRWAPMKEWLIKYEGPLWVFVFIIFAFVYLSTVSRPIRDAEAKYLEIPREMIITGDWITPHLDFVKYYTKPPLSFWIVAIGYRIFGIHIWVARAVNILWGFFLSFLIGLMARHLFGRGIAPIASTIFLLTSEVYAYALDAGIEFALISCITASLLCFWLFWQKGELKYLRYFYLWMGLGYLVKGFLGFVIPSASVFIFILITGNLRKIKGLIDPVGIILFLIEVLPWTLVMSIRNPDFLKYFVINEHIGRLLGHRDTTEALFSSTLFLEHMAGEFFPWVLYILLILKAIYTGIKQGGISRQRIIFLVTWASVPFTLFSLSKNKVDFYGLHVYPALIILLAYEMRSFFEKKNGLLKLWAYPWLILAVIALVCFTFICIKPDSLFLKSIDIPSIFWAKIFLFGSVAMGLMIWVAFMKRKIELSFFIIALYMGFFFVCTKEMYRADFDKDSMKFATDIYNKMATRDAPIFCSNLPEFAHIAIINFYTKRIAYVLKDAGDILPRLQDRRKMYIDEDEFIRIVKEKKMAFLIGKTEVLERRLEKMKLRYNILGTSNGRAIFLVLSKNNTSH